MQHRGAGINGVQSHGKYLDSVAFAEPFMNIHPETRMAVVSSDARHHSTSSSLRCELQVSPLCLLKVQQKHGSEWPQRSAAETNAFCCCSSSSWTSWKTSAEQVGRLHSTRGGVKFEEKVFLEKLLTGPQSPTVVAPPTCCYDPPLQGFESLQTAAAQLHLHVSIRASLQLSVGVRAAGFLAAPFPTSDSTVTRPGLIQEL
ncbi:hypothetical protein FQA47_007885 [Oryzias melastigma]|uniref:Uncharacterized protein n=1 Tax=Oryzias melastigma TaxID=30732 RepID=A0A834CEM2_ORYME|nr:hypothetical protein FQA47_007885 [Oryzias melastigma]